MFDSYENTIPEYQFSNPTTGDEFTWTAQELFEFYTFNEHSLAGDFDEVKRKLDIGLHLETDHYYYDWGLGVNVYKGRVTLKKIAKNTPVVKELIKSPVAGCRHDKKYINEAGGTKFWVCPSCKKDLGDVK